MTAGKQPSARSKQLDANIKKVSAQHDKQIDKRNEAAQFIAERINGLHDLLYAKAEKVLDERHLRYVSGQIDAVLRKDSGVLINRINKMIPDSAANFRPIYLGLQVVTGGSSADEALERYNDAVREPVVVNSDVCTSANPTGAPLECVPTKDGIQIGSNTFAGVSCTPMNVTGEPKKSQAVLKAAPEGFNLGYAGELAARIAEVYKVNPRNIGEISFGSIKSPIQPRA